MVERGWGRIITIASGAGTVGPEHRRVALRRRQGRRHRVHAPPRVENARAGVTANTLAIGLMGMPDPKVTAALARQIPVGRTGAPEDIGYACVYLASTEAEWVTGQTIQVNGGSVTT